MSIKPTEPANAVGPHFLSRSGASVDAGIVVSPIRDACAQLSESIERTAWNDDPQLAASQLAEWDRRLLVMAAEQARLDGDPGGPRELAESAVRDWRRLCRSLSLTDCQTACNQRLLQFIQEEADLLQRSLPQAAQAAAPNEQPPGTVDAAIDIPSCWLRCTTLQLEALAHGRGAHAIFQQLSTVQTALRELLPATLHESPLADAAGQRCANELVDLSEAVLTSAEDLAPHVAASQMEHVAECVQWFLSISPSTAATRRRLRRKRRRLRGEAQERRLQGRLFKAFGRRNVARFDQLVLALILFVFALLFVEAALPLSRQGMFWLHVADTAACCVFLWDFGIRLALAPDRSRWFLRHFLIDLIPSIPYAVLFSGLQTASRADFVRLGRAVRLLRVQPLIRLFRAFGFMARGLDRLARRFAPILNRSVILYPTRAERARATGEPQQPAQRIRRLHVEVQDRWKQLVLRASGEQRAALAMARLDALKTVDDGQDSGRVAFHLPRGTAAREVPAEVVLRRLGSMTPQQVIADLGEEGASRLARVVRTFARPPLCWFPLVRKAAPRIGPWMTDSQVVAAAARQMAALLKLYHDRWFWLADLHGTVTPSVFVDRLGTMLVKSSFRPAYRLAVFGGVYAVVYGFLRLMPFEFLEQAERFLSRFVGSALVLLGAICCVVFSLGWWLKRLAREATEFYEQAAEAQFLSLTEVIRSRHLQRDAAIFHHRVLKPEWRLSSTVHASELPPADGEQIGIFLKRTRASLLGEANEKGNGPVSDTLERVALLYRDSLDGAMFVDSDHRTTCQLLGNPAVRQFLLLSHRVGRKQAKALCYLDLGRQKSLFGGPYLWFNFISRAVAHGVACLIVDYNRHAVPLDELELVSASERRRYERWLATRSATNSMPGDENDATDERTYVTTAFTALHFLDFDAQRDREVEERFGPEVLRRLQRDRSVLIRRVFGTYPWNLQPREKRILNLFALYERWLAGGRMLLLPLFTTWAALRGGVRLVGWICQAVREIRRPDLRVDRTADIEADFATAVRKIERMRRPIVDASLQLRAMMDPEYLGVPVPGSADTGLEGADVHSDLQFLDAEPWIIERVQQERARAAADMQRLDQLFEEGLLARTASLLGLPAEAVDTPVHRRAAAVAYLADYRGVRRLLSAPQIIAEVFERAPLEPPQPPAARAGWLMKHVFNRYCREHNIDKPDLRAACWWAVQQNLWGVSDALRIWHSLGQQARARGDDVLADILRHPGRINEQLVSMRTIQTLAVLDVLNYRQHVYELGQYAAAGDRRDELMHWHTLGTSGASIGAT